MKIWVGKIVQFRVSRKQGETFDTDYPGIVYKIHPSEGEAHFVGLTVFYDGIASRYGKVHYSEEPKENCWSLLKEVA